MTHLLLGTAQWGLDYGVTNAIGRLPDEAIAALVGECRAVGIEWLDTAPSYGDAELRVGAFGNDMRVQTKLAAAGCTAPELVDDLEASLARLRRQRADAVLIHDWPSLTVAEVAIVDEAFAAILDAGLTAAVGISGYTEADLTRAMRTLSRVDVAQLPVNALDQRLEGSAEVAEFRAGGGRVQARSVLLQGVLAGDGGPFAGHPDVQRWRDAGLGLSAAVGYVRSRPWIDEIVIGVTSPGELQQFMAAWQGEEQAIAWPSLATVDLQLIDPRMWPSS